MVMVVALFLELEHMCPRTTMWFWGSTLLYVTTIKSLMPTNEKYLVGSFENNIDPKILSWEKKTYGGFMENHKGSQDDTTKDLIIER